MRTALTVVLIIALVAVYAWDRMCDRLRWWRLGL